MTYGEIYEEICFMCWPGDDPPDNIPAYLRRKILTARRMINRQYNFWFTLATAEIETVPEQGNYDLPEDYKEIEKTYFNIYNQTFTGPVLRQIELTDHIDLGLMRTGQFVEYPSLVRIDGSSLYLYPAPSHERTLNLLYWKFLPVIAVADMDDEEDDISIFCSQAIIYHVASDIKLQENEWQTAQVYRQRFEEEIEGAMQEDKVRRSIPETRAPYE
jgi:hypothetical protein